MRVDLARTRIYSRWLGRLRLATGHKQEQTAIVRGIATQGNDPWLTATPRVCLHDVPTTLRAGGLPPSAPVTLSANLTDENGKEFVSHAHYMSDEQGSLDVTTAAAVGGSYKGVFPAGLLTTLAPAPHEFPYMRLFRRDPSSHWKIALRLMDGHQPLGIKAKLLTELELERHLMAPGVQRRPVREGRVRGTLYMPSGEGPFPGVIDMFGGVSGLLEYRSAMLASRGIASLALAYCAYDDLPDTSDLIDVEYFEEALRMLLSQDGVVPDRCGVVASSKAVQFASCMATYFTQVKALVALSGFPIAADTVITHRGHTLVEGWKLDLSIMTADQDGRLYPHRERMAQHARADHPQHIPIEQADDDTYFLMVAGGDDTWPINLFHSAVRERMDNLGRSAWLETVEYPGASHIFDPPYGVHISQTYSRFISVVAEDGSRKRLGVPFLWGGNPKDHCRAQEDLWPRMRAFLIKHVRDNSSWYKQH